MAPRRTPHRRGNTPQRSGVRFAGQPQPLHRSSRICRTNLLLRRRKLQQRFATGTCRKRRPLRQSQHRRVGIACNQSLNGNYFRRRHLRIDGGTHTLQRKSQRKLDFFRQHGCYRFRQRRGYGKISGYRYNNGTQQG